MCSCLTIHSVYQCNPILESSPVLVEASRERAIKPQFVVYATFVWFDYHGKTFLSLSGSGGRVPRGMENVHTIHTLYTLKYRDTISTYTHTILTELRHDLVNEKSTNISKTWWNHVNQRVCVISVKRCKQTIAMKQISCKNAALLQQDSSKQTAKISCFKNEMGWCHFMFLWRRKIRGV